MLEVPLDPLVDPIDALAREWVAACFPRAWNAMVAAERDFVRRAAALALREDPQAERPLLLQRVAEHALMLYA